MRIIAGEAKGRVLTAPKGMNTRPTSDKLRGSVFNILFGRVQGARVLDLFAGTGALGLEAVSRGAREAVLVDVSVQAIRCIRKNAEWAGSRAAVMHMDYRRALEGFSSDAPFDLIFLDPPYRMDDCYKTALETIASRGLLAKGGRIVVERSAAFAPEWPSGFEALDTRGYGETHIDFVGEAQA